MKTKTTKKTTKMRNRTLFSFKIEDLRTAADQSKGLPSYDCVKDILAKYDLDEAICVAVTEAVEGILADYDRVYGIEYV